ncbi:MAG TPA: ABC transporter permease DevC [Vicinamibacterales bacterium]|jgi:putative ABC transport system permease protein|nr:ABC transporter permease DevC [Vicinamibacterales bacterium]
MLHKLAWYQLVTEKRRLLAALAGIAFAVLLQLMQFGFREAMFVSATLLHRQFHADLILVSPLYEYVAATGSFPQRRLYQALGLSDVESVAPVYVGFAPFKNPETHADRQIVVIGFDPDDVVLDIPSVIQNAKYLKVPDAALFDQRSRPDFGPIPREFHRTHAVITEVAGRRTTIGGLFELGVSFAGNGNIILSDSSFRSIFHRSEDVINFGLVNLKPGVDLPAVQLTLTRLLTPEVKVFTRQQLIELEQIHWDKNTPTGFIFTMGMIVGLMVGAVIVYQILYTDVTDHLGEYATLKAMGYTDRALYLVVLEEALMLSVCGFPLGFALAEALYKVARNYTLLPIEMTAARALVVLAMTVGMSCAAGLLAMRKLRTADPAEVF